MCVTAAHIPLYCRVVYGLIKPGRAEGGTAALSHILPGLHNDSLCVLQASLFPNGLAHRVVGIGLKLLNGGCQRGGRARIWEGQGAL